MEREEESRVLTGQLDYGFIQTHIQSLSGQEQASSAVD